LAPLFGRKKEPKEVFDENMKKAKKLYDSSKRWKSSESKKLLKYIEKAQEIAKTVEVDQEDIVWLWSVKGNVFNMGYHKLDEALECYEKALSINPRGLLTLSNKLQVLFRMKKWDEFIKDCDKTLRLVTEARKRTPEEQGPNILGREMVVSGLHGRARMHADARARAMVRG
jgi:tetratricopeptide (TPR) repeat protein